MPHQVFTNGLEPVKHEAPMWLEAVLAAARPVRSTSRGTLGRLKRWIRRLLAKAARRGGAELFADQQALNQAMVEALRHLASAVQNQQIDQRQSSRLQSQDSEYFREELRVLHKEVGALHYRPSSQNPASPSVKDGSGSTDLEAFYHAFEEIFRGSETLIEARLETYRPWVVESLAGFPDPLWLDLGCGRGEWLRLLNKAGIKTLGVDSNPGMVAAAQASGLHVLMEDLMEHLRARGAGTVDGLSAFHVVEHLPPDLMLELLREGLRVVRPGGALILETPNPENLQVGAHTFHLDPTHLKPVPPAFLEFLVRQAGWEHVEVVRLHPEEAELRCLQEQWAGNPALLRAANLLFGPRDYAVMAKCPISR